jgi:putative transposase
MKLKTHLTAQEIADLKLDGLPTSARRVRSWAADRGWDFFEKSDKFGGRHFAIASLPEAAQADLKARRSGNRKTKRPANNNEDGRGRPSWWAAHPEVGDAVEAFLTYRKVSSTIIMEMLEEEFAELPSSRSLRRFMADFEQRQKVLLTSFRNPDQFKGKYRVSIGDMSRTALHAHHIWEIDTTPADVMTLLGRKAVLGIIDRFSRRTRFMVCDSESAQSVRRFLIDTIRAWGVMPQTIMTDRGSGFINKSITSALNILGIEPHPLPPGSPEKKPYIERVFGTFTRHRAEMLPGYIGHNVAEAQALRARARKETGRPVITAVMSPEELQAALDGWTDGRYYHRVHGTLKMSPMAKEQSSPRVAAAAPDEDTLRRALSALVGPRTVGKRGIEWKSGRYWCPALVEHIGRAVSVRRDEEDLGALFIFDEEDKRFIGTAINAERSGLSEEEFARQARADQEQLLKVQRAEMRTKQKRFSFEEAARNVLIADARAAGKVTSLPVAGAERSSPALDSLAEASSSKQKRSRKVSAQVSASTDEWAEKSVAEKVAHVDAVLAAHARGEPVDEAELHWARGFVETSFYRAEKIMIAHFAPRSSASSPTDSDNPEAGRMSGHAN